MTDTNTQDAPDATRTSPPPPATDATTPPPASTTTPTPPAVAQETRPKDPRIAALHAMFPDYDELILYSVLDSVGGDQDRALDTLLGMSDPEYKPSDVVTGAGAEAGLGAGGELGL
ncbi:hypothetical protein H0H87_012989, partial [Tephrocybe sp. NHM501043]